MGTHPIFESDFDCLTEMFWRQILTRPVIPITSAVATSYFINDSQFKTVLAKDHEKVKVFGFRGSPDTHALLTYLNWAGISYEFENVNPFNLDNLEHLPCKTTALSDLPVTCLDQKKEIYVNGSSEAISFIESKKNYNAENLQIDYEQINNLYPKTKLKFQDRHAALNKFLYTKLVIMNRYQPLCPPILNPEGIPLGGTDPAADKVLQRCTKAREKANGDLKQAVMDILHEYNKQSLINTYKSMEDADWFIGSKIFFLVVFSYVTKRNATEFCEAANTEALKSQGGGANRFNTVHNQAIQNLIAKEIIELKKIKGKEKFFGGPEPNFADIEIYGILNFIEHFEPEIFNELITQWSLEKWYKRVKTYVS